MYVDMLNWKAKYWSSYSVLPFAGWQQKELWGLGQEREICFSLQPLAFKKWNKDYKLPSSKNGKKINKTTCEKQNPEKVPLSIPIFT